MKTELLIKDLKIKATSGKETIAQAKDFYWIDSNFNNCGTDKKSEKTKEIKVAVLEITENATFAQLFTLPEIQALTQSQILGFIRNHKEYLRQNGYATFFLFKVGTEFFVANVHVHSYLKLGGKGPDVSVNRFSSDYVWFAEYRHRIVVPQLTLESFSPSDTLTLEQRVKKIEEWIEFWETVETPWNKKVAPPGL